MIRLENVLARRLEDVLKTLSKGAEDVLKKSCRRLEDVWPRRNNLNLNNYSFEFTPTETSAGGTLLYIANHLSYKCRSDLNIYKRMNWNLLLLKLSTQKNQILKWESFTDIYLWILLTLIAVI